MRVYVVLCYYSKLFYTGTKRQKRYRVASRPSSHREYKTNFDFSPPFFWRQLCNTNDNDNNNNDNNDNSYKVLWKSTFVSHNHYWSNADFPKRVDTRDSLYSIIDLVYTILEIAKHRIWYYTVVVFLWISYC